MNTEQIATFIDSMQKEIDTLEKAMPETKSDYFEGYINGMLNVMRSLASEVENQSDN